MGKQVDKAITFKSKLVKMIKDVENGFDNYSISPMIRQVFAALGLYIS